MMFQPKMDVLSSALDEFLGKLEPMEGDSLACALLACPPILHKYYWAY